MTTILVVDDNDQNRTLPGDLLARFGYRMPVVANGAGRVAMAIEHGCRLGGTE